MLRADLLWVGEYDTLEEAHALVIRALCEYTAEHTPSSLALLSPDEYPPHTMKVRQL